MATGWRVTGQRGIERLQDGGRFDQGVEVSIITDNGVPNTFFIPAAKYNVTYVEDVIQEWVDRSNAIHMLGA